MNPKKESVLTILKHHSVKHTLLYLSIMVVSLCFIKIAVDGQLQNEIKRDMALKFQRDMSTLELYISTQSDLLDTRATSALTQYFKAYANFSGKELTVIQFPESSKTRIYVYDRVAKQLTSSFNDSVNQPIIPVFDFYDRITEGFEMQKKGLSVGVLKDPVLKQLAYGYLMMTMDQRYYVLVTLGLEDTLKSIYQSTYAGEESPYSFIQEWKTSELALVEDQRPIYMPLDLRLDAMTYLFESKTGYSFTHYAFDKSEGAVPLKSPLYFMGLLVMIVLVFIGAGFWNYRDLKSTYDQLAKASKLFNKNPIVVEDIVLDSYDVVEIRCFLSIVKEVLQNIESLLLQRQEQQELLIAKNSLIQTKRLKMAELYQESLCSSEQLTNKLALQKSKTYQSIKALMYAIEIRDSYTRGHSDRVEFYAEIIASQMKISMVQLENVKYGALLHDVGKIGIRETILNKSIDVTHEDTETFKMHPHIGWHIVAPVALMDEVKCIILQHHERMDGTGYPQGLMGEQIHPLSRIVAVADAYDAMTSNRPYRRSPLTRLEAIEELQKHAGSQFDKDVVRVFIDYLINEEQKG